MGLSAIAAWAADDVTVYKNPNCGCCQHWVSHMREAGFKVTVIETLDGQAHRSRLGVPGKLASCHTAEVQGYALEGHVPASEVRKRLAARPAVKGLAVPGMPANAPGMGEASAAPAFEVMQLNRDGTSSVFSQWPAPAAAR